MTFLFFFPPPTAFFGRKVTITLYCLMLFLPPPPPPFLFPLPSILQSSSGLRLNVIPGLPSFEDYHTCPSFLFPWNLFQSKRHNGSPSFIPSCVFLFSPSTSQRRLAFPFDEWILFEKIFFRPPDSPFPRGVRCLLSFVWVLPFLRCLQHPFFPRHEFKDWFVFERLTPPFP